jgi:hypothetical protein
LCGLLHSSLHYYSTAPLRTPLLHYSPLSFPHNLFHTPLELPLPSDPMEVCEDLSSRQYEEISSFRDAKVNIGGFTRLCTSVFLLLVYFRNKRAASFSSGGGYYVKALILPSYFQYIVAIMCSNLVFVSTFYVVWYGDVRERGSVQ